MPLDTRIIRQQFPILQQSLEGHPLIYLDNAATSQKPQAVLDAMDDFYTHTNANINRGVHRLGEHATIGYEKARVAVQRFLNAKKSHEILFTRGTTEAINLVARSWGSTLQSQDHVVLSQMEHHSNIVPWLQLKDRQGIVIDWLRVNREGQLSMDQLTTLLREGNVTLVAITGLSNVLGVMPDLPSIIALAHTHGALVLMDAAQLVAHQPIDVQALDVDFLAFSGHKIYGPTGIGVLYGKHELLSTMPPFLGGGDMITTVDEQGFSPAELPRTFEAGTPPIAEAIGLQAAIAWIEDIGFAAIAQHEQDLMTHALRRLRTIDGLHILGPTDPQERCGCISFVLDGVHPHDLTQILGDRNICLRAGHHCTQPLHNALGIAASTRLSVAAYTSTEDVDACVAAIEDARTILNTH